MLSLYQSCNVFDMIAVIHGLQQNVLEQLLYCAKIHIKNITPFYSEIIKLLNFCQSCVLRIYSNKKLNYYVWLLLAWYFRNLFRKYVSFLRNRLVNKLSKLIVI